MCAMKFSHSMTYDAAPEAVAQMLADPAFRQKVCDAVHAVRRAVTVDGAGKGMEVVVEQTWPSDRMPGFAKKIVGDEINIVQRETWQSSTDASLDVAVPGKPGGFAGTITLTPQGGGTQETVAGEVKVRIPLVGGKLEGLIGDMLERALKTEERVGRAWLAGDR